MARQPGLAVRQAEPAALLVRAHLDLRARPRGPPGDPLLRRPLYGAAPNVTVALNGAWDGTSGCSPLIPVSSASTQRSPLHATVPARSAGVALSTPTLQAPGSLVVQCSVPMTRSSVRNGAPMSASAPAPEMVRYQPLSFDQRTSDPNRA